jgi:hypothetical protein
MAFIRQSVTLFNCFTAATTLLILMPSLLYFGRIMWLHSPVFFLFLIPEFLHQNSGIKLKMKYSKGGSYGDSRRKGRAGIQLARRSRKQGIIERF